MGRFRYRMQSILDIKIKMETQAKQNFAAAKKVLDEEEEKLEVLYQRKAAYEEEAKELLAGTLNVLEITTNKEAILRMEEYIVLQLQVIERARRKVENAREALKEVMQEREIQEKLKEKAFENFLAEEKALESKEIDQLVSYTYGKRIQYNNALNGE
ncbi:MAG: flagellar export protein FliJ [Lachnospiraceae bacterium]|nr:flagellar export protein FliJ [Lachnospiraceae bacterium]